MKEYKKIYHLLFLLIISVLISAALPLKVNAVESFEIVGWYDESCHDSVISVKVNGVEVSKYNPDMYDSVSGLSTVSAPASGAINVEITLEEGYTISSIGDNKLFLSGVQSETDCITNSSNITSISLPDSSWLEYDQELYLTFTTERDIDSDESNLTTIDNVVLDVEKIDCGTEISDINSPAPKVSVPSESGYKIVPDSICWVKEEGINYIENVYPLVAKGSESAIFRLDITDSGRYIFDENISEDEITINNGELLDYDLYTYGGPSPESVVNELCLTVRIELNHDIGEPTKETVIPATCTEPGQDRESGKCSICNEDFTAINIINTDPLGHDWGEWETIKEPSTTETGLRRRVCKNDPEHIEEETIPKINAGSSGQEPTPTPSPSPTPGSTPAPATPTPTPVVATPTPIKTVSGLLLSKMTAKGSNKLVLSWNRIDGAEGYDIFFAKCDSNDKSELKKAATITGNSTLKWVKKGLLKKASYKAYVKAWYMRDGKKIYACTSPTVHAFTSGASKYYTNPKSVKVKKTKVSLRKGKTYTIKASVKKLKKNKKLMSSAHESRLRYISSDMSVATVTRTGKIRGMSAGTCNIYVIAVNGVRKTIKVTVKQ